MCGNNTHLTGFVVFKGPILWWLALVLNMFELRSLLVVIALLSRGVFAEVSTYLGFCLTMVLLITCREGRCVSVTYD